MTMKNIVEIVKEKINQKREYSLNNLIKEGKNRDFGPHFLWSVIDKYLVQKPEFELSSDFENSFMFEKGISYKTNLKGRSLSDKKSKQEENSLKKDSVQIIYQIQPFEKGFEDLVYVYKPSWLPFGKYTEKNVDCGLIIKLDNKKKLFKISDLGHHQHRKRWFTGNIENKIIKMEYSQFGGILDKMNIPIEVVTPYFRLYSLVKKDIRKNFNIHI